MSKTLTLSLNKLLLIEAVKADTYITGAIDKSAGDNNHAVAYNEQAGDDEYHERKLLRTLRGAVGALEARLAEFVDSAAGSISDTLSNAASDGSFTISVVVSDRYNSGLATPIAQLSQEYIINKMLSLWWQAIKPTMAKDYFTFAEESLNSIKLCLTKTAPASSTADYDDVSGTVTT